MSQPNSRATKTCTECKQAKLRCDSKERFPDPCSRCRDRKLHCTVDASFKRTPARRRLEDLNKELQALRGQKQDRLTDSNAETSPSLGESAEEDGVDDFFLNLPSVFLEGISLESSLAMQAFQLFADLFRPQLPILGPLNITDTYNTQPLLFWTIVLTVADHIRSIGQEHILQTFRGPYEAFLQRQALGAPLPLHKIQALIIICEWPLGVDTQPRDPTWLYSGVAIQAARFMSLDRQQTTPSLRSLGVTSGTAWARAHAWLGCFYVSTSASLHLGLPPPISSELDLSALQNLLQRQKTAPTFAARIRVQLVVAKYTNLLTNGLDESSSLSLLRLLDMELSALLSDGQLTHDEKKLVEVNVLDARMHFYAMFVTKASQDGHSRNIVLKQGLTVAQRIVHLSTADWRNGPSGRFEADARQAQRSLPKNHYRGFAFATIFLLRFFYNNKSAPAEEAQAAANYILLAQEHFRGCSLSQTDEFSRTARIFEILAQTPVGGNEPLSLRMNHRMGVSIVLDAVTSASEAMGRATEAEDEVEAPSTHQQPAVESSWGYGNDIPFSWGNFPSSSMDMLLDTWNDPSMNFMNFDAGPSGLM